MNQETAQAGYRWTLAIDPGETTGYARRWRDDPLSVTTYGELPMDEFLDMTHAWLVWAPRGSGIIVCENYLVTLKTVRTMRGDRQWSLEQIGVLRYEARRHHHGFVLQRPGDVLPLVTDRRLEALGWRHPTENGHQDDAHRHLAYYMTRATRELRLET